MSPFLAKSSAANQAELLSCEVASRRCSEGRGVAATFVELAPCRRRSPPGCLLTATSDLDERPNPAPEGSRHHHCYDGPGKQQNHSENHPVHAIHIASLHGPMKSGHQSRRCVLEASLSEGTGRILEDWTPRFPLGATPFWVIIGGKRDARSRHNSDARVLGVGSSQGLEMEHPGSQLTRGSHQEIAVPRPAMNAFAFSTCRRLDSSP